VAQAFQPVQTQAEACGYILQEARLRQKEKGTYGDQEGFAFLLFTFYFLLLPCFLKGC